MASRQGVADFVEVADFSPGIWSPQLSGAHVVAPPGAAQPDITEGCIALASGCLAPGPRVVTDDTYTEGLFNPGSADDATRPISRPYQQVVATAIFTPTTDEAELIGTADRLNWSRPDHLFVAHIDYYDPTDSGEFLAYYMLHGYNLGRNIGITGPDRVESTSTLDRFEGGYQALMRYGWASLATGFSVIIPGTGFTDFLYPILYASYQLPSDGISNTPTDFEVFTYPHADVTDYSTSDDFAEIAATYAQMAQIIYHQGRIVGVRQGETTGTVTYGDPATGAGGVLRAVDNLEWNPAVGEGAVDTGTFEKGNYVGEGGGTAIIASMSANTLLVIKQTGGGFVVRGDLARPQVQRLPGLPAALGAGSIPAQTPIGCVFGTRDGVWAWNDGNAVQLLTPQMKGWWWKPGSTIDNYEFSQPKGKFNYRHPFVLIPNDYLFDTSKSSLWKLSISGTGDRAPYYSYEVSATGHVYAFPVYQNDDTNVLFNRFDFDDQARSYTWHSHALFPLDDRRYRAREFQLRAQGLGDVVVTLLADSTELWSETFQIRSDGMQTFRAPIGVDSSGSTVNDDDTITYTGSDLTVVIASGDPNGDDPAPVVHAFKLGYTLEQTV